jgi:hypothetical protein
MAIRRFCWAFVVCLCVGRAAQAQLVRWADFDPFVVPLAGEDGSELIVQTDGSPDRLELVTDERSQLLDHRGGGLYAIQLSHEELVGGYRAPDRRNFVGFLDVYTGGARVFRGNMFIGILDESISRTEVTRLAADAQASGHVLNLFRPRADLQPLNVVEITKTFYRYYQDTADFLAVASVPASFSNRTYNAVRNNVKGIGLPLFNSARSYGSRGRLQGYIRFPIVVGLFDLAETAASHEIGHRWINYLAVPALRGVRPHWPVSTLARSVMGWQNTNIQGLQFPWQIVPIGNGEYRLETGERELRFHDVDLYLMGLIRPDEVGEHLVFQDQGQAVCDRCVLGGPTIGFGVQDIIEHHGVRRPDSRTSQRHFQLASIVVSTRRPLTANEFAFVEFFAARGESQEPLHFASGFSSGTTLPFFLATGGRATLQTKLPQRRR